MEQVRGRGLQQLDGRVGLLQWPPFRGELADLEAVLFRQSGDHPSKLIPLTRVTKTPPRGTGICEPRDDVGLNHCP